MRPSLSSSCCLSLACFVCVLLNGCSLSSNAPATPETGPAIQGTVHGGQQPITGATIQLYAVGTTGYGSTATPLISATLTTSDGSSLLNSNANAGNANNTLPAGNFTITGDYTCPAGDPDVYIMSTGGNRD